MLPKVLTNEQKQRCFKISQELLDCTSDDPNFLNNIITTDESWLYCTTHDKAPKLGMAHLPLTLSEKDCMDRLKMKLMFIIFSDCKGVVQEKFVPHGQAVNVAFYMELQ